jgi:hypothetical protein
MTTTEDAIIYGSGFLVGATFFKITLLLRRLLIARREADDHILVLEAVLKLSEEEMRDRIEDKPSQPPK